MSKNIFNNQQISGIIFDLDGTLIRSVVDFPEMKRRMIDYIFRQKLTDVQYSENQTTNEIILDLNEQMINNGMRDITRKKVLERISEILTEVEFENVGSVELLPGVKSLLSFCKKNGIKMSILTRASEKYTIECLKRTGITDYFRPITTRDDFTLLKAKPHKDSLDHVLNLLNLLPENVIFVGDHSIDFWCAKKNDLRFVGIIPDENDKFKLRELDCWKLIKGFNELEKLLKKVNNFM